MRRGIVALLLLALAAASYSAGWARGSGLWPPPGLYGVEAPQVKEQFGVFWEAWDIAQKNFVSEASLDATKMTYGAIQGMLDSLGDQGHTRFLSPDQMKLEETGLAGKFEGIGAQLAIRNTRPTVVAPLDGSPAEKAGIRAGDIILAIDGQDTGQMSLDQVVLKIRGKAGTTVRLTVLHPGDQNMVEISIQRQEIKLPTVSWARVPGETAALVRVSQFAQNTQQEFRAALEEARASGANAIILDLRNNPGGVLDQAVLVASEFLKSGDVLLQRERSGKTTPYPVKVGGTALDIPLVALVNGGSASASEIVAGALQDQGRAQVIGQPTFGTGTVLSQYRLRDGSAMFLGTAEWLTPKGRKIRGEGIKPDLEVPLDPTVAMVTPIQVREMTQQELMERGDAQLVAALNRLKDLARR